MQQATLPRTLSMYFRKICQLCLSRLDQSRLRSHSELYTMPTRLTTWSLKNIKQLRSNVFAPSRSTDRSCESCRTPRRNAEINAVTSWFTLVSSHFINRVEGHILGSRNPAVPSPRRSGERTSRTISGKELFYPVVPLLEATNRDRNCQSPGKTQVSYGSPFSVVCGCWHPITVPWRH